MKKTIEQARSNETAFMMTQYCNYGAAGTEEYKQYYIDEIIRPDISINELSEYNEYLSENSYETFFSFDEIDMYLEGMEPFEVFRLATFSNVSFADDYLQFDGYGNLKSFSEYETEQEMKKNDSFLDWYYDKYIDPEDQEEIEEAIKDCNILLAAGY